ncbi:MAG: alpha/beta hydrolase [Armatimonadota bacterium]
MKFPFIDKSIIRLWPDGAPGASGTEQEDCPWFSVHLPPKGKSNGTAVIILPGGGYQHLADDYEGTDCAEWMNSMGVTAFVLRYRLAPRYHHPSQILDAQRAIRMVRCYASNIGVDPLKIGIWGFSAGGHLASTTGTHFGSGNPNSSDEIDRVSSRPDFMILSYPVISFSDPYSHIGSRINLIGENPDPVLIELLSNEKQVTPDTPPAFIFHTDSDNGVPSENSVEFYLALRRSGVPAELHIYAEGPHGVGMAVDDPVLRNWTKQLANWMYTNGLISTPV